MKGKKFFFQVLVYFDKEDEHIWVAHCLDLGLVAVHKDMNDALLDLLNVIKAHLDFAHRNDNWEHLYHPAPIEFWRRFGKLIGGDKIQVLNGNQYKNVHGYKYDDIDLLHVSED